jgi:hypothetical protein
MLSQRDIDLDSAILLHNYGMSCLYHSLTISNKHAAHKLRSNALKLVQWSRSVLSARVVKSSDSDCEMMAEKAMFIAIVVTRSMAQTLYLTSREADKVEKCLQTLECLKGVARELGYWDRSNLMVAAAA